MATSTVYIETATSAPFLLNTTTSTDTVPIINIDPRCGLYYNDSKGNNMLVKDYEGIPENLILNVCVWLVMIILYTFLRHIGDYGQFGFFKSDEHRRLLEPRKKLQWNKTLFGKLAIDKLNLFSNSQNATANASQTSSDNEQSQLEQAEQRPAAVIHIDELNVANEQANGNQAETQTPNSNANANANTNENEKTATAANNDHHFEKLVDNPHAHIYKEKHFLSWIVNMCKLKDQHIQEKCGKDAHYYIVFQRYLIVYLLVISIIAVSVLFPINYQGSVLYKNNVFGSTTILNVMPDSPVLWVHLSLSWVFLVIGLIFMRLFSAEMSYTESDYISRSVLITHYPDNDLPTEENVRLVKEHFVQAYPDLTITDIQFCYDISRLAKMHKEKRAMFVGKIESEKMYERTNVRPKMHPFHFGYALDKLLCCQSDRCFDKVDAIEFYSKKEAELTLKIERKRLKALSDPLGVLFVTFENQKMAKKFLKDYRFGILAFLIKNLLPYRKCETCCYLCHELPKDSPKSDEIKSNVWNVRFAKAPSNIKWENITKVGPVWWLRILLINIILFILMVFFTTPSILIEKLSSQNGLLNITAVESVLPTYVAELLPSLILRLLAVLLPVLVSYTSLLELHWTRSAENRSIMIKVYTLLLFMLLILPTLGLTSLNALLEFKWLNQTSEYSVKWRCISDNGAFFLKYVTTCSLIGTALDLLRLPDLFLYLIRMAWSRSKAERFTNRMESAFEFDYGVQYAWILAVFTIVLSFSVVCPLIAPFGLFYMILKHIVDRYNIYFAYVATKVDKEIHKSAVTFCIFSLLMLQLCILFFIAIRNEALKISSMTIVQIVVCCITFTIYFGRLFFGVFKKLTPFNKKKSKHGHTHPNVNGQALNESSSSNNSYNINGHKVDGEEEEEEEEEEEDEDDDDTKEIENRYRSIESIASGKKPVKTILGAPSSSSKQEYAFDELGHGQNKLKVNNAKSKHNTFDKLIFHSPFLPAILRPLTPLGGQQQETSSSNESPNQTIITEQPKQPIDLNQINLILNEEDEKGQNKTSNINKAYQAGD